MGWGICPVWLLAKVSFGMLEPARPGREQGAVTAQHGLLRSVWVIQRGGFSGKPCS